ncbi:MAG: class I SAM-dependent methyltransferase [Phycisphaerales bacterium]|nr:class I SAM-dependent methyltransferase [Phycisphaerales bacterium]
MKLSELITGRFVWQWLRRAAPTRRAAFTAIYRTHYWGKKGPGQSVSGSGSNLDATGVVRAELPGLIREHRVRTILDAPCGDLFWIRHADLAGAAYTGADIVGPLVRANRREFPDRRFEELDLVSAPAPAHDLVLCRDCLVHLPLADALRALANISAGGSRLLLTTTFPDVPENADLAKPGLWRPINLQKPPFNLPPPIRLIDEQFHDRTHGRKCLGLWALPLGPGSIGGPAGGGG